MCGAVVELGRFFGEFEGAHDMSLKSFKFYFHSLIFFAAVFYFAPFALAQNSQNQNVEVTQIENQCRTLLFRPYKKPFRSTPDSPMAVIKIGQNQITVLTLQPDGALREDEYPISSFTLTLPELKVQLLAIKATLLMIPEENVFYFANSDFRSGAKKAILNKLNRELNVQIYPFKKTEEIALGPDDENLHDALVRISAKQVIIRQMDRYAKLLAEIYKQKLLIGEQEMKAMLGTNVGRIEFRAKNDASIHNKLVKRAINEDTEIRDQEQAEIAVNDGVGFRIILNDPNEAAINDVIDNLITRIKSGYITKVKEVRNYYGTGSTPYLSQSQMLRLTNAIQDPSVPIEDNERPSGKPSGYTSFHIDMTLSSGVNIELQIRGERIDRLATVEHVYHDVRKGKYVNTRENPALQDVVTALKRLRPSQYKKLLRYLSQYYAYERSLETGAENINKPVLPTGLNPILSIENVAAAQNIQM